MKTQTRKSVKIRGKNSFIIKRICITLRFLSNLYINIDGLYSAWQFVEILTKLSHTKRFLCCWTYGRFVHNHFSQKNQRHARAYIDFNNPEDVIEFADFFTGHVFVNEKGNNSWWIWLYPLFIGLFYWFDLIYLTGACMFLYLVKVTNNKVGMYFQEILVIFGLCFIFQISCVAVLVGGAGNSGTAIFHV